jgi:hypothetical protein
MRLAMSQANLVSLAFISVEAGEPTSVVHECIHEALETYVALLSVRPCTQKVAHPPSFEWKEVDDYSLGNSCDTLNACYFAILIGADERLLSIAGRIWDPEQADYVGKGSEVCTSERQRLAYAFREWATRDTSGALDRLNDWSPSESSVRHESGLLEAVALEDRGRFTRSLSDLLAWHEREARRSENRRLPELLFSLPAVAYARLALKNNILGREELPADSQYFPERLVIGSNGEPAPSNPT